MANFIVICPAYGQDLAVMKNLLIYFDNHK